MSEKLLLMDSANAWYRCWHSTQLDRPGGPVMIMTYMLRRFCDRFGKSNVIVCLDRGDGGRKELDSEYKAQRTSTPGVWEDFPFMLRMLEILGIKLAWKDGYEADDVMGSLAMADSTFKYIHSYDKDFYQLVTDHIHVLRPEQNVHGKKIPERLIDRDGVIEEFGCPPNRVVVCKSFLGDSADNIPKLPIRFTKGFKEQFYKVLLNSETVAQFYEKLNLVDPKYHADLENFKSRALLNEKLLAIKTDLKVVVKESDLDVQKFEELCKELDIKRLKVSDWEAMPEIAAPAPPVQGSLF